MASPQNEAVVKQQSDTVSSLSSSRPPPYADPPNANRSYNNASSYDNPPSYNNTQCSAPPFPAAPPYQYSTQYGMPPPPPPPPPPPYAASSVPVVVQSSSFYAQQTTSHVIIVRSQPPVVPSVFVDRPQRVSMVGAIVLSCFACWCCGLVFGGIAFIVAMIGQSSASAGDTRGAIRLRNASYGLSIIAIVIGGLIIGLAVAFSPRAPYSSYRYPYYYYFY